MLVSVSIINLWDGSDCFTVKKNSRKHILPSLSSSHLNRKLLIRLLNYEIIKSIIH